MVEPHQPVSTSPQLVAPFAELLLSLFRAGEMKQWLVGFAADTVPDVYFDQADRSVAHALAEALVRRGLVAPPLFASLRAARPQRADDVDQLAASLPPPLAASLPPPLTASPPPPHAASPTPLILRWVVYWAPAGPGEWQSMHAAPRRLPPGARLIVLACADAPCFVWLAVDPFDRHGKFQARSLFPLVDDGGRPRATRRHVWERLPPGARALQEDAPAQVRGWRVWVVAAPEADASLARLAPYGADVTPPAHADVALNIPGVPAAVPFVLRGHGACAGATEVRFA